MKDVRLTMHAVVDARNRAVAWKRLHPKRKLPQWVQSASAGYVSFSVWERSQNWAVSKDAERVIHP